jgi:GH35 family endo-1,4-beta-xylanase
MKNKTLIFVVVLLCTLNLLSNAQQVPTGKRLKDIPAGPRVGITVTYGFNTFIAGLLEGPNTTKIQNIVNTEFNLGTATCYPAFEGWETQGQFTFNNFNALVNWLVAKNKTPVMHMLCGPDQYFPDWFTKNNWTYNQKDSLLKNWIYSIMESNDNKNKVKVWNVINESFNFGGDFATNTEADPKQRCKWYEMGLEVDESGLTGADKIHDSIPIYIRLAFEYAADKTNNILELRDYNIETNNKKSKAFYQLTRHLLNKGVKLGAVGPQCHFSLEGEYRLKPNVLKEQVKKYTDLGLQVYFTEVDFEDATPPFTTAKAQTQKQDFKNLVKIATETGVSFINFWCLTDGNPYWLKTGSPNIFAENFSPKPSYYGVQEALTEAVFTYDTLATGTYIFAAKHSGKVLQVSNSSTINGAAVWQYPRDNNNQGQLWQVRHVGGGYHKIIATPSGKALDVQGISCRDGALLQQWSYGGGDNQLWKFEKQPNGFYKIAARNSGKALDVAGVSFDDEALIQQWRFGSGDNQLWALQKINSTANARKIVTTTNTIVTKIELFPNPAVSNTQLTYNNTGQKENAIIQITNAQGTIIAQKQIVLQNRININNINTKEWAKGIYVITLTTLETKKQFIEKLIVQ